MLRAGRVTSSPPSLDSAPAVKWQGSREKHRAGWRGWAAPRPPGRRAEWHRLHPQYRDGAGTRAGDGEGATELSGLEEKRRLRRKPGSRPGPGRGPGSGRAREGSSAPTRGLPVCLRRPRVPVQVQQQRRLRHPHQQGQPLRRRREPQRSLLFSSGSSLTPQLHLEVQGHGGGSTAAPLTAGVSQRFAAGRSAAEVRPERGPARQALRLRRAGDADGPRARALPSREKKGAGRRA